MHYYKKDLIENIPMMLHFSWTKKSRSLYRKIRNENIKKYQDVIEFYWSNKW